MANRRNGNVGIGSIHEMEGEGLRKGEERAGKQMTKRLDSNGKGR